MLSSLRPLRYPQTDVFVCVFSVDEARSLDNYADKWYPGASKKKRQTIFPPAASTPGCGADFLVIPFFFPLCLPATEVAHHCPDAIKLLVGTKSDLRTDDTLSDRAFVSFDDAVQVARRTDAASYVEVSSVTGQNVMAVLQECALIGTRETPPDFNPTQKGGCVVQ
jgi:GTPase SAR1 family protein